MSKFKIVGKRFLKGFISGAITSMLLVTVATPSSWTELAVILNILGLAGIAGGINGALLAGQKWYSYVD